MSNHLAFATVTATLRALLDAAVKDVMPGAEATVERPDAESLKTALGVNIFLYQVTPNATWRNADLPTRRPDGTAALRPQAAFDLHYILTFHGKESDYEPQCILGLAVRLLHSQPVLSRPMVVKSIPGLGDSDLADQVELVRFAPLSFNLEELSKLWSAFFQVPYKLSVAYQASVVLIESEISTEPALPVQARNLYILPFRQPELDEVVAAAGSSQPILPDDTIVLRGRNLRGELTRVRIGGVEIEPEAGKVRDDRIEVDLKTPPFAAGDLRAGVLGAQVVHFQQMGTPPAPHRGGESNAAPFVLRPRINDGLISQPDASGIRTVTVGIEPQVRKEQRAVLLLNALTAASPKAYTAASEPRSNDADPVTFKLRDLTAGQEFLVRVQVDGAESLLEMVDGAYAAPKVTVPS